MRFLFNRVNAEAELRPDVIAITDDDTSLTWFELKQAVAHTARLQSTLGSRLGLLCGNSCDYAVAQLAAAFSGITLVPLPDFFSDQQLATIVRDAALDGIITDEVSEARAIRMKRPVARHVINRSPTEKLHFVPGFEMVIYTSGSSGAPKGVRHGERQFEAAVHALAIASQGSHNDRYLSVLPLSMLLEAVCAIFLPILCGARIRLATEIARQVMRGRVDGILDAVTKEQTTAMVLVPQLLRALLFQLKGANVTAPPSLRFVAVGGASVPADILTLAATLKMPVYEGYGLSECCSVVTLNSPGAVRSNTAGRPIEGVTLHVEDGELVVESPTVMNGYLNGPSVNGRWRTGDLGTIDADGFVTIHGRKDNLIVTSLGRNVSPEWVESALMADPRIALAVVTGPAEPSPRLLLVPTAYGQPWFETATAQDVDTLVAALCHTLPAYAVPKDTRVVSIQQAAEAMLLTANGRPVRCRVQDFMARPINLTH